MGRDEDHRRRGEDGGNRNGGNDNSWMWWAAGAMGVAGAVVGTYLAARGTAQATGQQNNPNRDEEESIASSSARSDTSVDDVNDAVSRMAVSPVPVVNNLNTLLNDVHQRYVAIKKDDLKLHYDVFVQVIYPLHNLMKRVDAYYGRYSSRFQFAGSHYDGLRIKKPDEFDMDIIIGLPVNFEVNPLSPEESDIVLEPKHPGFVQLRAGAQYLNILLRDGADCVINAQAYKWLDERKYITRSKFVAWFRSVVDRAFNQFDSVNGTPCITIGGVRYTIDKSFNGPAYTLIIRNSAGFKLDVDLVPALRFPESRWLGRNGSYRGYREIEPAYSADYWMVVPKPIKYGATVHDSYRSWRVAMHDQEKKIIYNSYHLRQANRLLKKLRDALEMNYIASYYIKTLFLWKILELNDPMFWRRDVATIFKVMVREFYQALDQKTINYFWNKKNNMLELVPENILKGYANKLQKLVALLEDDSNYMGVLNYLLTPSEHAEYAMLLNI